MDKYKMDDVRSEIEVRLHEANLQMQRTLQSLSAFSAMDSAIPRNIVSTVTSALRRVREAGLLFSSDVHGQELSQEAILYWDNLKKLQKVLPALHVQLRIRRANLDRSLSHRQTVTRWVEVNKEIF
ncbi:MAG TPA: hypothetical protein VGG46_15330 [Terriglobales bacterium]|jgi:hypothetical protein